MTSTASSYSRAISEPISGRASGFSIFLSAVLIACGLFGIVLPIKMSFGVVVVLAWLLMLSGFIQFVHVLRCRGIGNGIWKALVAALYLGTGLYLRFNLRLGLAALTLALIAFFLGQGLTDILAYVRTRNSGVSKWLLLNGVLTLILGLMIWRHWPSRALWVVGTLVGINMVVMGVTRLMVTVAIRHAMT